MEEYLAKVLPYGEIIVPVVAGLILLLTCLAKLIEVVHGLRSKGVPEDPAKTQTVSPPSPEYQAPPKASPQFDDTPKQPEPAPRRPARPTAGIRQLQLVLLVILAILGLGFLGAAFWIRPVPEPEVSPPGAETLRVEPIGLEMKRILPGRFRMGSPADERKRGTDEDLVEVVLSRPFYVGRFEVTQQEYEQVMQDNPSYFSLRGEGREEVRDLNTRRLPVDSVTIEEALEFCRRLSDFSSEKKAGRSYRLLTEAESTSVEPGP